MIFVTVGSQLPFPRLIGAVEAWAKKSGQGDVFLQVGETDDAPKDLRSVRGLEPAAFEAEIARASVIVGHAGTGTLMAALAAGKPVVMLARRAALGETRNDHQLTTVERFSGRPGVFGTADESELGALIEEALQAQPADGSTVQPHATGPLVDRLRSFLDEHLGQQPKRGGGLRARRP